MKWEFAKLRAATRQAVEQNRRAPTEDMPDAGGPHHGFPPPHPPQGTLVELVRTLAERHQTVLSYAALSLAICTLVASALFAVKLIAGPSYTATTLIQPYLLRREYAKETAQPPLDDKMIIDGAIQIIGSHPLNRRVAEKLELDREATPSVLTAPFRVFRSNTAAERSARLDEAARTLASRLFVANARKSHLVEVAYTASTPEQAARIANAVASEYILFHWTGELAKAFARAQAHYVDLAGRYSEQHPKVAAAKVELAGRLAAMTEAEKASTVMNPQELLATGLVVPATAVSIPSNRRTAATLGIALMLGLLLSFGYILYREPRAREFVRGLIR